MHTFETSSSEEDLPQQYASIISKAARQTGEIISQKELAIYLQNFGKNLKDPATLKARTQEVVKTMQANSEASSFFLSHFASFFNLEGREAGVDYTISIDSNRKRQIKEEYTRNITLNLSDEIVNLITPEQKQELLSKIRLIYSNTDKNSSTLMDRLYLNYLNYSQLYKATSEIDPERKLYEVYKEVFWQLYTHEVIPTHSRKGFLSTLTKSLLKMDQPVKSFKDLTRVTLIYLKELESKERLIQDIDNIGQNFVELTGGTSYLKDYKIKLFANGYSDVTLNIAYIVFDEGGFYEKIIEVQANSEQNMILKHDDTPNYNIRKKLCATISNLAKTKIEVEECGWLIKDCLDRNIIDKSGEIANYDEFCNLINEFLKINGSSLALEIKNFTDSSSNNYSIKTEVADLFVKFKDVFLESCETFSKASNVIKDQESYQELDANLSEKIKAGKLRVELYNQYIGQLYPLIGNFKAGEYTIFLGNSCYINNFENWETFTNFYLNIKRLHNLLDKNTSVSISFLQKEYDHSTESLNINQKTVNVSDFDTEIANQSVELAY